MRRILLATVATSLLLAGCGGSDGESDGSGDLDSVSVSTSESPEVAVDEGFTVDETSTRVVTEGGGEEVESGDSIKLDYVGVNGTTGKQFDSTFGAQPQTITMESGVLKGFQDGLVGQKVGSRVLVAIPPKDGFGETGQPTFDIKEDDTLVFLFDVVSKVPSEATGKAKSLPSDVPRIKLDGDKHPSGFTKTGKTTPTSRITEASSHIAIQGEGETVTKGQTIRAQYVGQIYPDGEVFDESWSKGAASFPLGTGGLIKCWDDLLVGEKLGSRIVLVCPADTAYGDEGSPPAIKGGDTLIFAIDLLDASDAS